jgi:hypothetical protein
MRREAAVTRQLATPVLVGGRWRNRLFELEFQVGERQATVLLTRSGHPRFPHPLDEGGQTLGPELDAAVRARASEMIILLDLATTWRPFRGERQAA